MTSEPAENKGTLDSETRLLAAIAYGEASTADVFEEMAALASIVLRQSKARGYSSLASFTGNEKSFSFVVSDGNKRYKRLMGATAAQLEKSAAMTDAIKAARNAFSGGTDYSNGAYFWDGADIKTKYETHFKVRHGIRFTNPSHYIYSIRESTKLIIKKKTTKAKVDGKIVTNTKELYRYDHIYESTAALGGTIFWKQSDDYMKFTGAKAYR
ncbi:hypothetical protein [Cupriavidus oxalaticus]|uniref:hypothetical protein n=1 Tax=Cupriavidus oxalaticus TaxID=96344 RepID=UPI00317DAE24